MVAANFTTLDQPLTVLTNQPDGDGWVQQGNGFTSPKFSVPWDSYIFSVAPKASDWPGTGSSFDGTVIVANGTASPSVMWAQTAYPDGSIAVKWRPFGIPYASRSLVPANTSMWMTVGNPQGAPWPGCGVACLTCSVTQDSGIPAVVSLSLLPVTWNGTMFNSSSSGSPSIQTSVGFDSPSFSVIRPGFLYGVELQTDPNPGSSNYCSMRVTVTTNGADGPVSVMVETPFARNGFGPTQPMSVPLANPLAVPARSTVEIYHACYGNSYSAVVYGDDEYAGVAFQLFSSV